MMLRLMPDSVLLRELYIHYGCSDENLRCMKIHEEIDGVVVITKEAIQKRLDHPHKKTRNAAQNLLKAYKKCTNLKGMIRLRTLSKYGLVSSYSVMNNRKDFAKQVVTVGRWQFVKPSQKLKEVIEWANEGLTLFRAQKEDMQECTKVMKFGQSIFIGAY